VPSFLGAWTLRLLSAAPLDLFQQQNIPTLAGDNRVADMPPPKGPATPHSRLRYITKLTWKPDSYSKTEKDSVPSALP
jgi:hypothetical protein